MLAIENELLSSQAVDSHLINVRVEDGIAALSGSVGNLPAGHIAVNISQRVLSVIDQIEVRSVERSDADLKLDIHAALAAHPGTWRLNVKVSVVDGAAELTGTSPSYGRKTLPHRSPAA